MRLKEILDSQPTDTVLIHPEFVAFVKNDDETWCTLNGFKISFTSDKMVGMIGTTDGVSFS